MASHARPRVAWLPRLVNAVRAFGPLGVITLILAVDLVLVVLLAFNRDVGAWATWTLIVGGTCEAAPFAWNAADPYSKERK